MLGVQCFKRACYLNLVAWVYDDEGDFKSFGIEFESHTRQLSGQEIGVIAKVKSRVLFNLRRGFCSVPLGLLQAVSSEEAAYCKEANYRIMRELKGLYFCGGLPTE
ncbi:hypothetical protein BaRGS_00020769 [Batillaria attramentaria]|uniref:LAGLIDADG homing endonuclease n=1 Tax=Batillaria attramentaria TaxID=370345 RepID=A0ABD0KLI4_9CAEN